MGAQGLWGLSTKWQKQYWSIGPQISKNESAWTCCLFPHLNKNLWKRCKSFRSCFPDCSILRTLQNYPGKQRMKGQLPFIKPVIVSLFPSDWTASREVQPGSYLGRFSCNCFYVKRTGDLRKKKLFCLEIKHCAVWLRGWLSNQLETSGWHSCI